MNNSKINLYVILLLINVHFPKSAFQIQQLMTLWEDKILNLLPRSIRGKEIASDYENNPLWKTRIVVAITELQELSYIKRLSPYSMQYQRYTITDLGVQDMSDPDLEFKNNLSGDDITLTLEIEKFLGNI